MNYIEATEYRKIRSKPFSHWAIFTIDLRGKDLYYKGKLIYKYEVYSYLGFKNARAILEGKTPIRAVPRDNERKYY